MSATTIGTIGGIGDVRGIGTIEGLGGIGRFGRPVARTRRRDLSGGGPVVDAVVEAVVITLPVRPAPRASVVRARPVRPAPLRLTRRGRLVLHLGGLLLVALATVAVVLVQSGRASAGSTPEQVPVGYHAVLPGETLWQIAVESAPGQDPRETVSRIVELNALDSSAVRAGQRLALPLSG